MSQQTNVANDVILDYWDGDDAMVIWALEEICNHNKKQAVSHFPGGGLGRALRQSSQSLVEDDV